ncbi:MAG TPA: radical SAM protein [Anaerolineales bacterium]|nr:radical SAM protein [Anaerolineales bacterium]
MSSRILLLNPARHFIANEAGVGYLTPLGLVLIGGPLLDAGFEVKLIDHDMNGWPMERLLEEVAAYQPNYILLGHSGSTASHNMVVQTVWELRKAFPEIRIIYGGVYPSYAFESILRQVPEIDVIVRGEGEKTIVELISAWEKGVNLEQVAGIAWRRNGEIVVNRPQPAIQNLDDYRPGWELLDWKYYQMFGFDHAAGLQFSRGCTLTCSYCGQWMFWKKWRHRSPQNIVENMKLLKEKFGVRLIWFADENFAADRDLAKDLLERIIAADLGLSLNLNMTAADVVRDVDLLPLYKKAGVDYIVMGVESLKDSVVAGIRKNNPFATSKEAVRLLRQHDIISLTNIIYGLEDESWQTLFEKFRGMLELDSDILNAMYLTPHFWTSDGKATDPAKIIQADLAKWSYRNQVIATSYLNPFELFLGVKLTEALFHLRPKALWRLVAHRDGRYRQIMRTSILAGIRVVLAEIWEFAFDTKFVKQGKLTEIIGAERSRQDATPLA